MATLALYELFTTYVSVDGSNNTLLVADLSGNGFDLAEGTSTNGGVYSSASSLFSGYGCILMDGVDDYLVNTGGLANAMAGGSDNSYAMHMTMQHVADGTSGDVICGQGDNSDNNPICRFTEGTTGSWTVAKRGADTPTGTGAGILNVGTIGTSTLNAEIEHTGTAVSLFTSTKPQSITTVASGTAADVNTLGTLDNFAVGTLLRVAVGGFSNFRWSYLHVMDAVPTSTERTQLRSIMARYTSAPQVIRSAAERVRRDRHLHAQARPITWKKTKSGLMVAAEDTKIVQVNGFRALARDIDFALVTAPRKKVA